MTERILITGATGFVGRQIMRQLSSMNVSLIPVIRPGKEAILNEFSNVERIVRSNDIFAESSMWWEKQLQDIDIVVHVAWYVQPGDYLNSPKNLDCLTGSINLAIGATKARVKKFVGVGTCFEYDLSHGELSIKTPLKPSSLYANAKAVLYNFLSEWFRLNSIRFSWCRLFYLYGQGEDNRRLVPYIRNQISCGQVAQLTSGKYIRDFLDVADAGKKIANIVLGNSVGPTNICSGNPISIRELAEKIADEYGRRDLLGFGLLPDRESDPIYVVGVV